MEYSIFGSNKCYGITQNLVTEDFMLIMNNYLLDDLIDLLYKSENKVVDDFIRYTQINSNNLGVGIMEFVPYDQFKYIEFIAEGGFSKVYKATWIDSYIRTLQKPLKS